MFALNNLDVYSGFLCLTFSSPVPEIMWKKLDGELPPNHEVRMAGAHLHLFNVQFEDSGTYQCEAVNSKGKDYHTARLSVEGEENAPLTAQNTVNDKAMTKQ